MSQSLQTQLREKIDEAKRLLPMPQLLEKLGLGTHAKKEARCPFSDHEDKHPSFSIWDMGGAWFWKCHSKCGTGDEISFLAKYKGLSRSAAIALYLEMAGFPAQRPKSREYPELLRPHGSRESLSLSKSPEYPVSPMSNGQGLEEELKGLAARNACTQRNTARERRWQLMRDLRAVQKRIGRKLSNAELMLTFNEWYQLSRPFLDPQKTRDAYLAAFLAELGKVRVPTGECETIKKALECVLTLSVVALPMLPRIVQAPESWRRLAALHRELARQSANGTYFLSCRDAAKADQGLNKDSANITNRALAQLGVIKVERVGDARPGGKASEFRYLLPLNGVINET